MSSAGSRAPSVADASQADAALERRRSRWRAKGATVRSVRGAKRGHGQVSWHRKRRTGIVRYRSGLAVRGPGQRVLTRVKVAAGNRRSLGAKVRLTLTEVTDTGARVQRSGSRVVRLPRRFKTLRVRTMTKRAASHLELAVEQTRTRRGQRLLVGAARVRRRGGGGTGPTSTSATLGLLSIRQQGQLRQSQFWGRTSRYAYIVGYGWEQARLASVKAANPGTKMLLYLEAGATQKRSDCTGLVAPASFQAPRASWGIDYCWLLANGHEDWILRDATGGYLEFADYPGFLALDMGRPEVADQWARNAVEAVRSFGFDGVWADDVNTEIGHGHDTAYRATPSGLVEVGRAEYGAGAAAWADRVRSRWDSITAGDRLLLAANVYAVAYVHPGAEQALEIASHLDIYSREHQSQWLTGDQCAPYRAQEPNAINDTMAFARKVQARGASYVAIDYGHDPLTTRDEQVMAFGRSMFLLSWNGRPGGAYFYRPCGFVDPANPSWTTELGTPTGEVQVLKREPYRRPGETWDQDAKLLSRRFTGGLVLQNQLNHPVTVPLHGTYRTSEGRVVTSVTIPGSAPATGGSEGLPGGAALLTKVD